MTVAKFATMPRPGVRTRGQQAMLVRLKRRILALGRQVQKHDAEGDMRLAARKSTELRLFVAKYNRLNTGNAP